MSKFPKTLSIAFFVLVLFIQSSNAQSFYSQRGIGLLNYFVTAKGVGMGGVGLASSDKLAVNFLNPAALTNLPVTFISGNFRHDAVGLKSNSVDASLSDTNVMGVQFHVPLIKENFSMALGLMPLSNIEYSFQSKGAVSGNTYDEFYTGDGGVNNVFFSLAVKPIKKLSVGATGLFYFGSLRNVWRVVFNESSDLLNARTEVSRSFTAGNIRLGMQYDVFPVWRGGAVFTASV